MAMGMVMAMDMDIHMVKQRDQKNFREKNQLESEFILR